MLFLNYTGKFNKRKREKKIVFKMKNGKTHTTKFFTKIINPTHDNSFKNMFCYKKDILKSLLNSVLFPNSKIIEKIEYIQTYFAGKSEIKNRFGFSSKSIDVGCRCFLKKNNGLNIKNDILICDLEMQIGFSDKVEQRFIDYANAIRVHLNYPDTWVISFIIKENIDGNHEINFNKVNSETLVHVKNLQSIKLVEINLNHCLSLIENNEDIKIINGEELGVAGKEWIKFLSIPLWCESDLRDDVFVIPKYTKKNFISCRFIKKAISEIIYEKDALDLSEVDEHYNREERKENAQLKERVEYLEKRVKYYEEKEEDDESGNDEDENQVDDDEDQKDDENEDSEGQNDDNQDNNDDNNMDVE